MSQMLKMDTKSDLYYSVILWIVKILAAVALLIGLLGTLVTIKLKY